MIDINLLAARRAQRQRAIALMRLAFYGLFGMAAVIVLLWVWMTMQISLINGQITELNGYLVSMEKDTSRIKFLETQTSLLTPKVTVLKKVHDSELRWIEILRDIGSRIPANVGVTALISKRADRGQQVSVSGVASSERLVGAYMLALQPMQWCGPLQLQEVSAKQKGMVADQKEFEILIPLKQPIGLNLTGPPPAPSKTPPAGQPTQAGEL